MTQALKDQPRKGELKAEFQLRKLLATAKLKQAKAMLAVHAAADRGRRNKDWRASRASADAAIIPESDTLNARARQCVRDSWVGKSAVKAFSRNVVGCGVMPIPMVKDANGKPLPKINKKLLKLFWAWANARQYCDVEQRQTFWQKQNLTVEERVTVGEHLIVWSYRPNSNPHEPVGLRLQSFEAEQFDTRLQSYTDPATGISNQVRGGVEVDSFGAPVAYHLYTRNPADYLPVSFGSIRIPAARAIHYFKQERVLQTRGVTALAAILQDVRDLNRFRDATLWRAIMEACIGMVIKKDPAMGGSNPLSVGTAPGDPGQTASGMRTLDFVPGMTPELLPGEDIVPYVPSSPGNQYEPFTKVGLRGVGAGVGLSYSQIARQSESNYSAARQDMLEDRKEFEPEQEMLAHNLLLPLWAIFVRLAVLEGKLDTEIDGAEFTADPGRFCEAEYVAPAAPWIDPANEANAYEKLLKLKVMNREEVAALRGRRLPDIWDGIEAEQDDAKKRDIALPEEADNLTLQFKREAFLGFQKDGTVCDVLGNQTDFADLVGDVGLTVEPYDAPWLPIAAPTGPLVSGETLKDDSGTIVGGGVIKNAGAPEPKPPMAPGTPGGSPGLDEKGGENSKNEPKDGKSGKKTPENAPATDPAAAELAAKSMLFNDNHDADGKFGSGGDGGVKSKSVGNTGQREHEISKTADAATVAKEVQENDSVCVEDHSEPIRVTDVSTRTRTEPVWSDTDPSDVRQHGERTITTTRINGHNSFGQIVSHSFRTEKRALFDEPKAIDPVATQPAKEAEKKSAASSEPAASKPWHEALPAEQAAAVKNYVGNGYKNVRAFQEGRLQAGDKGFEQAQADAAHLATVLATAPKSQGTLYRGMYDLSERAADKLSGVGNEFSLRSISSFSASKAVAEKFSKTFDKSKVSVVLKVKNGSGVDISALSGVKVGGKDERELLVDRGARFKVVSRSIRTGVVEKYRYQVTLEQLS